MKSQSVGNWFQFVSMVAVMVGLILVIWELRQAREIVAAQIGADAFILMSQQSAAVMGEDAAKAIAKACGPICERFGSAIGTGISGNIESAVLL